MSSVQRCSSCGKEFQGSLAATQLRQHRLFRHKATPESLDVVSELSVGHQEEATKRTNNTQPLEAVSPAQNANTDDGLSLLAATSTQMDSGGVNGDPPSAAEASTDGQPPPSIREALDQVSRGLKRANPEGSEEINAASILTQLYNLPGLGPPTQKRLRTSSMKDISNTNRFLEDPTTRRIRAHTTDGIGFAARTPSLLPDSDTMPPRPNAPHAFWNAHHLFPVHSDDEPMYLNSRSKNFKLLPSLDSGTLRNAPQAYVDKRLFDEISNASAESKIQAVIRLIGTFTGSDVDTLWTMTTDTEGEDIETSHPFAQIVQLIKEVGATQVFGENGAAVHQREDSDDSTISDVIEPHPLNKIVHDLDGEPSLDTQRRLSDVHARVITAKTSRERNSATPDVVSSNRDGDDYFARKASVSTGTHTSYGSRPGPGRPPISRTPNGDNFARAEDEVVLTREIPKTRPSKPTGNEGVRYADTAVGRGSVAGGRGRGRGSDGLSKKSTSPAQQHLKADVATDSPSADLRVYRNATKAAVKARMMTKDHSLSSFTLSSSNHATHQANQANRAPVTPSEDGPSSVPGTATPNSPSVLSPARDSESPFPSEYSDEANMPITELRKCNYVLRELFSSSHAIPFIVPVPDSATVYHQVITKPMDLATVEQKLWSNSYTTIKDFEADLDLIWKNAVKFHDNSGPIPARAMTMNNLASKTIAEAQAGFAHGISLQWKGNPGLSLPEELGWDDRGLTYDLSSSLYVVRALDPEDTTQTRGFNSAANDAFKSLNSGFFEAINTFKADPHLIVGRHDIYSELRFKTPLPRLYISKNRTFLEKARDDPNGLLIVLYNVHTEKVPDNTDLVLLRAQAALVKPIGSRNDIDVSQWPEPIPSETPKAWMKVRMLKAIGEIEVEINSNMERDLVRKPFATTKLEVNETPASEENPDEDKEYIKRFVEAIMSFRTPDQVQLEHEAEIMRKLRDECLRHHVSIAKISSYSDHLTTFPAAEGFFKQVYFVQNDPTKVVQTFREMTVHQRVTEIASLVKLQNVPYVGQMIEVLEGDDGEMIGLSMERYQQTLKQYIHAHSHHRITAYQKYELICQMLRAMQGVHAQGLAHRDLSEVNYMVNEDPHVKLEDGSTRPHLYLIDFGKAVFCHADDVRKWWMPAATDDGVTPKTVAELEDACDELPWVKGTPDHGYRMYRSIQTLPKNRTDFDTLPYLIDPKAEDMYSIGVIIWKIFSETEPWHGIMDTDIKGIRYIVQDDYRIEKTIEREVSGPCSRDLLLKVVRARPSDRGTASELLLWLLEPDIKKKLIDEWLPQNQPKVAARALRAEQYAPSPTTSTKRRGRPPGRPKRKKEEDPSPGEVPPKKRKKTSRTAPHTPHDLPDTYTPPHHPHLLGAHASITHGLQTAVHNTVRIHGSCFALFLKSQRRWEHPPLEQENVDGFRQARQKFNFSPGSALPHGSYLVNMAHPDKDKRSKSYDCFLEDLQRCERLGIQLYNFHPGSTTGACTIEEGIGNIADCINQAHTETQSVIAVLENMAGAGNVIGSKFEELGGIIALVKDKTRVGVCLDTCHAFAAGYDLRSLEAYEATMNAFDQHIGIKYLKALHLNDSKFGLGCKKDRHASIGKGEIGLDGFRNVMNDRRLWGLPMVLETPARWDDAKEEVIDDEEKKATPNGKKSTTKKAKGVKKEHPHEDDEERKEEDPDYKSSKTKRTRKKTKRVKKEEVDEQEPDKGDEAEEEDEEEEDPDGQPSKKKRTRKKPYKVDLDKYKQEIELLSSLVDQTEKMQDKLQSSLCSLLSLSVVALCLSQLSVATIVLTLLLHVLYISHTTERWTEHSVNEVDSQQAKAVEAEDSYGSSLPAADTDMVAQGKDDPTIEPSTKGPVPKTNADGGDTMTGRPNSPLPFVSFTTASTAAVADMACETPATRHLTDPRPPVSSEDDVSQTSPTSITDNALPSPMPSYIANNNTTLTDVEKVTSPREPIPSNLSDDTLSPPMPNLLSRRMQRPRALSITDQLSSLPSVHSPSTSYPSPERSFSTPTSAKACARASPKIRKLTLDLVESVDSRARALHTQDRSPRIDNRLYRFKDAAARWHPSKKPEHIDLPPAVVSSSEEHHLHSGGYVNRVGFDMMTSEDLPTYSFTIQAKSQGYVRTRRSRSFLIATDLANHSDYALEWVIDSLIDDGDEVIILHVVTAEFNERSKHFDEELHKQEEEARHDAIMVRDSILERAGSRKIDMYQPSVLVVGTRGRSPIKGYLLGSVSQTILQTSPIPVIVVSPEEKLKRRRDKSRGRSPSRNRSPGFQYIRVQRGDGQDVEEVTQRMARKASSDNVDDAGRSSTLTRDESASTLELSDSENDSKPATKKSKTESQAAKPLKKSKSSSWAPLDPTAPTNTVLPVKFDFPQTKQGQTKIASWNVSGIKASMKKGFKSYVDAEDPDILCLQEIKVNEAVDCVDTVKYRYRYWGFEEAKGYGGVAVLSKIKPNEHTKGLPNYPNMYNGRVLTLEFPTLYMVATYVPNAGDGLKRLKERLEFDERIQAYLGELRQKKEVMWIGDLNVARRPEDLARPKTNTKTPGFTPEERESFEKAMGPDDNPNFIDTWRHFHPDTIGQYTYYSYRFMCRMKGIGWRIDYILTTPNLLSRIRDSELRLEAYGASDHIPIVCTIEGDL
ncbi:hypothetical protein BZG36_04147 [Bifiguratus adelaidae]|uniref:Apurinic-apyrimidinic endonuclease 1 n=1 Tax=Bifiguratus adelaidae TaxID=1938954 RepID=A0A261XZC8_9FUNG|nr:hypothetical protein BZG36_04147 [Bifiguratus adelaidae]